jgi:hypothetical protein
MTDPLGSWSQEDQSRESYGHSQGMPGATRSWKRQEVVSLKAIRGVCSATALTLGFWPIKLEGSSSAVWHMTL